MADTTVDRDRSAPMMDDGDGTPPPLGDGASVTALADRLGQILQQRGALPAERALAAELDVKRHKLRRALAILRERGELAPARSGRPASEGTASAENIVRAANPIEVIELRMMLEPGFARQAAFRASPREIAEIRRWATTAQGDDRGAVDLAFHQAVAAASRNRLGAELYAMLRRVGRDGRITPGAPKSCVPRLPERDKEHQAIAEAIAARDPEAAAAAMRDHLAKVHQMIMARMSPFQPV
ncbi:MAG: FCD domain-containing protein [Pseudomonadota bacterium]